MGWMVAIAAKRRWRYAGPKSQTAAVSKEMNPPPAGEWSAVIALYILTLFKLKKRRRNNRKTIFISPSLRRQSIFRSCVWCMIVRVAATFRKEGKTARARLEIHTRSLSLLETAGSWSPRVASSRLDWHLVQRVCVCVSCTPASMRAPCRNKILLFPPEEKKKKLFGWKK